MDRGRANMRLASACRFMCLVVLCGIQFIWNVHATELDIVEGDWFFTVYGRDPITKQIIPNLYINYTFLKAGDLQVTSSNPLNMAYNMFDLETFSPDRQTVGNKRFRRVQLPNGIAFDIEAEVFNQTTFINYFGWALPYDTKSIKFTFSWENLHNHSRYRSQGWSDPNFYFAFDGGIDVASILSSSTDANLYPQLSDLLFQTPVGVINCSANDVWNYVPFKVCSQLPVKQRFPGAPLILPQPPTQQSFTIVDERLNLTVNLLESVSCVNSTGSYYSDKLFFRFLDSRKNLSDSDAIRDLLFGIYNQYNSPSRYGVTRISGISYVRPSACNATSLVYDPDFNLLFNFNVQEGGFPTVEAAVEAQTTQTVAIAVGVSVSFVVVAVVILVLAHPGIRGKILPFSNRKADVEDTLMQSEDVGDQPQRSQWKHVAPTTASS